jgi:hypothetical protein
MEKAAKKMDVFFGFSNFPDCSAPRTPHSDWSTHDLPL